MAGVGGAALCKYDLDNLNCSGKSIMYITSLDIWDYIKKDLVVKAYRHATYAAVIYKIQQVILLAVFTLVDKLNNMFIIKEPGKYFETFILREI